MSRQPTSIGKYAIVRKIASGGMADVYLCRLEPGHGFSKEFAVKVVRSDHSGKDSFRDRFVREARLASSLSHPNIVSVFDFGQTEDGYFLVMEYVDGFPLSHAIVRMRDNFSPIPASVWRYWMENMLAGLGYLHARGIVHGDVSPSNVLVTRSGTVKIADFGISRRISRSGPENPAVHGKPGYLSPEALCGKGDDPRSDLFSAALFGVELLTGEPVFRSRTFDEARKTMSEFDAANYSVSDPRIGQGLVRVLRKALSPKPEDRYPDSDAFIMAIESEIAFRATRREIETYVGSLFPGPDGVETLAEDDSQTMPAKLESKQAIIREPRISYGPGARGAAIGIAVAAMAMTGSAYLYRQLSGGHGTENMNIRPESEAPPRFSVPDPRNPVPKGKVAGTPPVVADKQIVDGNLHPLPPKDASFPKKAGPEIVESRDGDPTPAKSAKPVVSEILRTIPVVQAIPWAKVYEGDRYLGETPIRSLELPVGAHILRFVNEPLGVDRNIPLLVREEGNQNLIVQLIGSRMSE